MLLKRWFVFFCSVFILLFSYARTHAEDLKRAVNGGSWHYDQIAGLRVRLPWASATIKNAQQVQGLIRQRQGDVTAAGRRFTSAVYAPSGTPFFVIWTRPDTQAPTQRQMLDLDAAEARTGLSNLEFDPASMKGSGQLLDAVGIGLQARVLFQLAKGETVFLGYFYRRPEDLQAFEVLRESFELNSERRIYWQDLAAAYPAWLNWMIAWVACIGVTSIGLYLLTRRRRSRKAPYIQVKSAKPLSQLIAAGWRQLWLKLRLLVYRRRQL